MSPHHHEDIQTDPPPAIIRTNALPKFHEDWRINVTVKSRVLTCEQICTLRPCFSTNPHFQTQHLKKDLTINVTSRVFTRFIFNLTHFEHNTDIIVTISFTTFHDDQTINVACCVLTRQNLDDA
ncbi:hypothetical protein DPMN_062874 [Dreissena polymorpha]|uniref:Uncharacterized protein n=1 Tax=Dreissena polymorpha TaxID=45954 RepID=A0A9D4HII7_DREPO|nr:hypothetical protein DPMN_062874 [Dreissena polymorpha]